MNLKEVILSIILKKQQLTVMKNRNGYSNQAQNRRAMSNRMAMQHHPSVQKKNQNCPKDKDQILQILVKQYLEKNGFTRTLQTFKTQKPVKRPNIVVSSHKIINDEEKSILQLFDKGQRQEFFKLTTKMFLNPDSAIKKLEFQLNVYFCIYTIHPCIRKATHIDKSSTQAFRKYIDTKGSEVSQYTQLLSFFALPHIPKPQEHSGMAHVFTKEWIQKLRVRTQQLLKENLKFKPNHENKKQKLSLQEMYERIVMEKQSIPKEENIESKQNCKHFQEIQDLKNQNKQMLNYIDVIQHNLKELTEVSKANLIQSNKKWFQFSKQILQLARKASKGEKVEKLQKYEKFFGNNIDELIYNSADISIFEKNSYFTQDISLIPQQIKDLSHKKGQQKKQSQYCQIDMNKIALLFLKADKAENEKQICMVLKALKDRFYKVKNLLQRRQIIVTYQRTDICAAKPQNYHIQKKLLLESPEKVKEFYLRFLNHMTTDNLGNQYLSSSEKLIGNLIEIIGTTNQAVVYRKHAFGILQRFSYMKQSQTIMISKGIIPIIFKIFRNQTQQLNYSSIQYLMGLIMNLAIKRQSIKNFEKYKNQIFPLLLRYIDFDDTQIRGYVNGTIYVLLQMPSFRQESLKHKLYNMVQDLHTKYSLKLQEAEQQDIGTDPDDFGIVIRQYKYILERLEEEPEKESQICQFSDDEDDEEQDDELEDLSNLSDGSNSSEYIEGTQTLLSGQQLLIKKFALLGPEAIREELLTRQFLDETGRKSHNMTTSINHSKRIDKVFHKSQRPETPSLLPNLDLSAHHGFR